ncbi:MAG TPA: hypothetical protein VMA77_16410 [Solirubrobacteraceae bacterium]|nr:hypothetical protein [Solirubrobacteraceae bacterium]
MIAREYPGSHIDGGWREPRSAENIEVISPVHERTRARSRLLTKTISVDPAAELPTDVIENAELTAAAI